MAAVTVAATMVAAGDGRAAAPIETGAVLGDGTGTGGVGSVVHGAAEGMCVGFVFSAFGFDVGACSGGLAQGSFGGAGNGAFGFGCDSGCLLTEFLGGGVGLCFGAG